MESPTRPLVDQFQLNSQADFQTYLKALINQDTNGANLHPQDISTSKSLLFYYYGYPMGSLQSDPSSDVTVKEQLASNMDEKMTPNLASALSSFARSSNEDLQDMQVILERFCIPVLVLCPCLLCPVRAGGYETSSHGNANAASSVTVKQQIGKDHQSVDATSSELPMPFAARFLESCISGRAEDNEFFLSRIKIPLTYVFSFMDEQGTRSTQGTLFEMRKNPETGGFALPLCMGDGGLDETKIRINGENLRIELIFGSGPNEELHFKKFEGKWKLIFVEWTDH
jgi:hypothetical protein